MDEPDYHNIDPQYEEEETVVKLSEMLSALRNSGNPVMTQEVAIAERLEARAAELEAVLRLYRDALERIIAPENDHRAATCRAIANEALKD